eukprot:gnl/Chilomastix_cuspidata/3144.p1 GENE.gnl/Chilomastix_cuspidata/3144~~gnl/Chilomastix_cuspidata/3144.p1  ORF type:complete len:683 (-),score=139.04 gnl/Chilomastix_cuspidata/3144:664-2712(-)
MDQIGKEPPTRAPVESEVTGTKPEDVPFDEDIQELIPGVENMMAIDPRTISKQECHELVVNLQNALYRCEASRFNALKHIDELRLTVGDFKHQLAELRAAKDAQAKSTTPSPPSAPMRSPHNLAASERDSLHAELAQLDASKRALRERYDALLAENERLHTEFEQHRQALENVTSKAAAQRAALEAELKETISRAEHAEGELSLAAERERRAESRAASQKAEAATQLEMLRSKVSALQAAARSAEQTRDSAARGPDASSREYADASAGVLRRLRDLVKELQAKVAAKDERLTELEDARKDLSDTADRAISSAASLEQKVTQLRSELSKERNALSATTSERDAAASAAAANAERFEREHEKCAQLSSRLARLMKVAEDTRKAFFAQRSSCTAWRNEVERLKRCWAELGTTPEDALRAQQDLRNNAQAARTALEQERATSREAQQEAQRFSQLVQEMSAQLAAARTQMAGLESERDSLLERVAANGGRAQGLERTLAMLRQEKEATDRRLAKEAKRREAALEELSLRDRRIGELEQAHSQVTDSHRQEVQRLTSQADEREKTLRDSFEKERARLEGHIAQISRVAKKYQADSAAAARSLGASKTQIENLKRMALAAASAVRAGEPSAWDTSPLESAFPSQPAVTPSPAPKPPAPRRETLRTRPLSEDALLLASLYPEISRTRGR